jgi:hypothetical protein
MVTRALVVGVAALVASVSVAFAQGGGPAESRRPVVSDAVGLPPGFNGPPPPALPETIARDAQGRVTVRAVRLTTPLRLDGELDEELYTTVVPGGDLIQTEPTSGAPATEATQFWISFDDDNVYFSVRVIESEPERDVANEMRRDSLKFYDTDHMGVAFDTFYDRRNAVQFLFNSLGGRADGEVSNEANWNGDWNPVWDVRTRKNAHGWTAEAAIPFKSLRYGPGREQIWGVSVRRYIRAKNEISHLVRVPDGLGKIAFLRISGYATLVGIEAPPQRHPLDVKPSAIASLSTDLTASPRVRDAVGRDISLDVKYGVSRSLTADFTVNTDFAQVEADDQQLNLTRFNLFFPEKRDFFLENAGIFSFSGISGSSTDSPVVFYSRRIGLDGQGHAIPIRAGARMTGRAGPYSIGLLDIQTGIDDQLGVPSTNFSVARIRRDVLRRSAVGALATVRSADSVSGANAAETIGVDGVFAFFENVTINTYWAKTNTPNRHGDDTSYRANYFYNADRYGAQLEHLLVGANFNPDIGFLKRTDFRKSRAELRFSPRPRNSRLVRKYWFYLTGDNYRNSTGLTETRDLSGQFAIDFENGDHYAVVYTDDVESLARPFAIAQSVTVPVGTYTNRTLHNEYTFGPQRPATAVVGVDVGPFWGGRQATIGVGTGRVAFGPQFAVEPGLSINRVTLPFGDFTAKLITSRVTYTLTPRMFVSGLLQYNSGTASVSTNVRFRWEYRPGSELFVVYNDGRDTRQPGFPALQTQSFVVKANRLLRF